MRKGTALLLFVLVLTIGATSCQQLPPPPPVAMGVLQTEEVAYEDAIPLEYGTLVAVTAPPDLRFTAGLWFEKPDKTIVFVRVNTSLRKIEKTALLLPRR